MTNAILLKTDGRQTLVEVPNDETSLDWYYTTLGIDYIDIVRCYAVDHEAKELGLDALVDKFCIVCDDEALLKPNPKVNVIASLLYGYDLHGEPICGDVLILKDQVRDDGVYTAGLTSLDIAQLQSAISVLIEKHNERVER